VNTSTGSAASSSSSSTVSTKPSSRDAVECVTTELKDMGVDNKNKNIAVDGVKKLVSYAKDFRLGFMELRVCDDDLFYFSLMEAKSCFVCLDCPGEEYYKR
jgi:hypothetical protein